MTPDVAEASTPETSAASGPAEEPGLPQTARSLWQDCRGLIHDHFRLAALETRRAGESLVVMIVAGVMVAVLVSGAWLGLMAVAVLWLIQHGMGADNAILLAVAGNLLAALLGCGAIRHQSRALLFSATRRHIKTGTLRERPFKEMT